MLELITARGKHAPGEAEQALATLRAEFLRVRSLIRQEGVDEHRCWLQLADALKGRGDLRAAASHVAWFLGNAGLKIDDRDFYVACQTLAR